VITQQQTSPTVSRTSEATAARLGGNLKELKRERSTSVKDIKNRFEELIKVGLIEQDQKPDQTHKAVKSSSSTSLTSPPERKTILDPIPLIGGMMASTSAKISVPALSLSLIPDKAREALTHSGSQSAKDSSKHFLSPRKFQSTPNTAPSKGEAGDLVFEMDDDLSEGGGKSGKGDKKEKKHKHKRKNSITSSNRVTKEDSGIAFIS